ncbi:MAG: hypothetical protein Kilf2KO_32650 [Rhodospirillales bacterium]
MAYRDFLLLLDETRGTAGRTKAAAKFAKACGARLRALHLSLKQEIPGYVAAELSSDVLAMRDDAIKAEAAASKSAFETACSEAGVQGEFHHAVGSPGDLADLTIASGRLSDLVILGQPDEEGGGWLGPWLLESVLLGCGRPALVVPYIGAHETIASKVLVAWDGGREAARALGDAMPLLTGSTSVTVLSVNRKPDRQRPSTQETAAHLAHHGIKADHHDVTIKELSPADYLLNRASDQDADLIVMGAYAHSRLRELVLGGMTKAILKHMTVPIFLSH